MSKMGSYVIDQIERGNFTVDQRGTYHVPQPSIETIEDRRRCASAIQTTTDSIQRDEGGAECISQAETGE